MKPPKYPVYDPAKDGNVFDWLVKTAREMREGNEPTQPPEYDYLRRAPKCG